MNFLVDFPVKLAKVKTFIAKNKTSENGVQYLHRKSRYLDHSIIISGNILINNKESMFGTVTLF